MSGLELSTFPIHLGLGATAEVEPEFTGGMAWYAGYRDRHKGDRAKGRLVTMHDFTESWDVWEMHTADVSAGDAPRVLFITAGEDTEHRPRG